VSRDRGPRVVALTVVVAFVAAACVGAVPSESPSSSGGVALRTFALYEPPDGTQLACPAFAVRPDVEGTLAGSPSDPELVWLVTPAGRTSIIWPAGFRVVFGPAAMLYDGDGKLFARAGERIGLGQVRLGDYAGTPADPYPASGLIEAVAANGDGRGFCGQAAQGSRYAVPTTPSVLYVDAAEQVQAGPTSEVARKVFDAALRFTMAHSDDIGYPWIDPDGNELVVSAATAKGRTLLEASFAPGSLVLQTRIRDVKHSYAELQRIQDDITFLASRGVHDADLIYRTGPDQRDDLTLVTISRSDPPLVAELARLYGADAIAVQIKPR
jgi:hypothetical protein